MSERDEIPTGAIENGREHFRRLAEHYDFECEGGPLHNCTDFISAQQCFERLAEHVQARADLAAERESEKTAKDKAFLEEMHRHISGAQEGNFVDYQHIETMIEDWIDELSALLATHEQTDDEGLRHE